MPDLGVRASQSANPTPTRSTRDHAGPKQAARWQGHFHSRFLAPKFFLQILEDHFQIGSALKASFRVLAQAALNHSIEFQRYPSRHGTGRFRIFPQDRRQNR